MKDRFIDYYGYLQEIGWDGNPAIGDALFRTSIRNIYAKDKTNTDSCYRNGKVFRHPSLKMLPANVRNTCSRDQVIMNMVSRVITQQPLPKVKIKFSDKFSQTPDMYLWMRAIRGSRVAGFLFNTWNYFTLPIMLKRNERLWKKGRDVYFAKGWRGRYPFYAFHLMSWMTFVLPDSRMKERVSLICIHYMLDVDAGNYLIWFLHGGYLSFDTARTYHAQSDFRPQRIEDRLPPGVALEDYSGPFPIDKDILLWAAGFEKPGCQALEHVHSPAES